MRIEVIISDKTIPLDKRCELCITVLNGDFNPSNKAYAICYLTYRHLLDGYEIDNSILYRHIDEQYRTKQVSVFEEYRWKVSLTMARLYLDQCRHDDCWWWNIGTTEAISLNPMLIINYLRLIILGVANNIIKNNIKFCEDAFVYAETLYKHFLNTVDYDKCVKNFDEIHLAIKQIELLANLKGYIPGNPNTPIKNMESIFNIDKTEPYNSLLRKTLIG